MSKSIEFTCWEDDEPLQIQLEPEAFIFIVKPNNNIRFEAINAKESFKWVLRIDHENKSVQLYPEDFTPFDGINIYLNEQLMTDWSDLFKD